ncbi:hypothetical protein CEXT_382311 [Caerostris extrusa]|uniref:Uncharacterized protein n=1 Tax=Caerostris extrusa TaxID=172846 RepID=A0AAV4Q3I7_CAEEX|nr:hypothetical protein CEXT_382311 [Caerostris extrusa]
MPHPTASMIDEAQYNVKYQNTRYMCKKSKEKRSLHLSLLFCHRHTDCSSNCSRLPVKSSSIIWLDTEGVRLLAIRISRSIINGKQ